MCEDTIEEMVDVEINIRVQEFRKAMDMGDYKKANRILEMFLYCKSNRDDKDVMVA